MIYAVSQLAYIVSASLFIFALHWMNTPQTARKGVYAGVAGTTGLIASMLQFLVLMASALFALHPAHTESVAWVTVPDPLMSAAVLGSVLCYLRYADKFSAQSSLQFSHRKFTG